MHDCNYYNSLQLLSYQVLIEEAHPQEQPPAYESQPNHGYFSKVSPAPPGYMHIPVTNPEEKTSQTVSPVLVLQYCKN